MKKAHVLFAIGDADWKYTRGKLRYLVERIAATGQWQVTVASHAEDICQAFAAEEVRAVYLPGQRLPLSPEQTVAMTDLMIRLTGDVMLPDSRLPFWKVIAMDDYLGSLDVFTYPPLAVRPDVVVYPLMGVDNNTAAAAHFYTNVLLEANKAQVPIVGLEVSPLGNRQTLGASLADYYAVKSEFSRSVVLAQEFAAAERTFIVPADEHYLLTTREDHYLSDFFEQEVGIRKRFGIPEGHVTVFIPHNVAFVFEIRRILASLRALPFPFSVILRVDPTLARQGLKEKDIAAKAYRDELSALPHAIIDDEGGWMWSLLLADVVIAPAWSVFTEIASSYDKLIVICHGWGDRGWLGDHFFVEPRPERAIHSVRGWVERRVLSRKSMTSILTTIVAGSHMPIVGEALHVA